MHDALGMRSRSKWASFSISQKSCITTGPRGPAVSLFWLSAIGRPAAVVICCLPHCALLVG